MQSPDSSENTGDADQGEQAFDARIVALIARRKLQQDALAKIKASIEQRKASQKPSGPRPRSTSK